VLDPSEESLSRNTVLQIKYQADRARLNTSIFATGGWRTNPEAFALFNARLRKCADEDVVVTERMGEELDGVEEDNRPVYQAVLLSQEQETVYEAESVLKIFSSTS
jgi:hypothetical protein